MARTHGQAVQVKREIPFIREYAHRASISHFAHFRIWQFSDKRFLRQMGDSREGLDYEGGMDCTHYDINGKAR